MTSLGQDRMPVPDSGINSRKPWHRRRRTWVAAALAVAAVVFVAAVVVPRLLRTPETVRVTDGSVLLADYLSGVQKLIHEENQRVAASGRDFATIAFMIPVRTSKQDPNTPTAIRHELEGAYLAQYWSNRENSDEGKFSSSSPLVRLVIADTGDLGRDWPQTMGQLATTEHLVAAAGLGSSNDTTQRMATELANRRIPMFGAVITSAKLTAPNLARVAPINLDEAGAAIHHLRETPEWAAATPDRPYTAYLVQDTAPEDSYATDLGAAYRAEFPNDAAHTLLATQGSFDGSVPAAGNALGSQVNTVCALDPDVVFFAGRSGDLRTFLGKLAQRPCAVDSRPLTVVSGDDIDHLTNVADMWVGSNITLLYTALASPQAWQAPYNDGQAISLNAVAHFTGDQHSYRTLFSDDLEDGHAIMAYDAVLTAAEAARRAATPDAPVPQPEALVNGLSTMNAQAPVPGASGWIYFQSTQVPPDWLPYNKAVPVLELDSDGHATLRRISSRFGIPPGPPT